MSFNSQDTYTYIYVYTRTQATKRHTFVQRFARMKQLKFQWNSISAYFTLSGLLTFIAECRNWPTKKTVHEVKRKLWQEKKRENEEEKAE